MWIWLLCSVNGFPGCGRRTGQLRAHLRRLIISVDPAAAQERYEDRLDERRVFSEQGEDGTANLHGLNLPPAETNRAMGRSTCSPGRVNPTVDPPTEAWSRFGSI